MMSDIFWQHFFVALAPTITAITTFIIVLRRTKQAVADVKQVSVDVRGAADHATARAVDTNEKLSAISDAVNGKLSVALAELDRLKAELDRVRTDIDRAQGGG
jgi:hypothetical protein